MESLAHHNHSGIPLKSQQKDPEQGEEPWLQATKDPILKTELRTVSVVGFLHQGKHKVRLTVEVA